MKYRINTNLNSGIVDYKGANISLFVPGTQVYDHVNNVCLVETPEVINHPDVILLTEEEYITLKQQIEQNLPASPEDEIVSLKARLQETEQAVLEMSTIIGGMLNVQ